MKKKILYIASLDSIHTLKWIDYFLKLEYEISVISLTEKIEDFKLSNNPNLYIFNKYKNKYLNTFHCLISIFFKMKFFSKNDIIHVHYIGLNGLISMMCSINNLVLTAWGDDIKTNKNNFLKNFLLKLLFKKSKVVTTDSNEMKNLMCEISKDLKYKTNIINFGINTEFFSKKEYNSEIEKKLKLENYRDHLKIISLRNHDKIYDIETLIYSIKKLVQSNIKVKCLIYGNGTETNKLKQLTLDLNLQSNILFMGRYQQQDLPYIFSIMDCYVSTSLSDAGIAASTAEAMACELPSISSNNSENNIWIDHGRSGFLFNNRDTDGLTNILKNLKNYNLSNIGSESRKIIIKNNDYNNEMNKMDEIYKNLLS